MRALTWLIWLFLGAAALVVGAYGVLLLINLNDEPLSAEAKAFAAGAALDSSPQQNGYFAALGWRAATEADTHAAGMQVFEHWRAATAEERETEPPRVLSAPDRTHLCMQRRADCLKIVSEHKTAVSELLAKHSVLMARIRALDRYPNFHTPQLRYRDSWEPLWVPEYAGIWRLGVTASAYAWLSGDIDGAIAASAGRIAVARRLIREAGDAIDIALGVAWLRSEYMLLSEIIHRDPGGARAHMIALEPLLVPLSDHELQSTYWIRREFSMKIERYTAAARVPDERHVLFSPSLLDLAFEDTIDRERFRKSLPAWYIIASSLLSPLFQPNATANLHFRYMAELDRDMRGPATGIGALARDRGRRAPGPEHGQHVYNPMGRLIGAPLLYDFVFRLHDVDRFIRLVRVQAALTKARVAARDVEAFLAMDPRALDPATGRPMRWDGGKSRIHVHALDPLWASAHGAMGDLTGEISVPY